MYYGFQNKWVNQINQLKILSDRETILYLKKNPSVGIIRYGNSELGLIVGNSQKAQIYDKKIEKQIN